MPIATFPKSYFKKTKVLTVWSLVLSGWHCQPPLLPTLLLKPFFSVLRSFQSVANLILGSHPVLNLLLIQSFLALWVFFKGLAILCKCNFHYLFFQNIPASGQKPSVHNQSRGFPAVHIHLYRLESNTNLQTLHSF